MLVVRVKLTLEELAADVYIRMENRGGTKPVLVGKLARLEVSVDPLRDVAIWIPDITDNFAEETPTGGPISDSLTPKSYGGK